MEDKWSFLFVHEILPQGCLISYGSCAVGAPSPSCGMRHWEMLNQASLRDDHFSDLASSYTTSKQSQF